MQIANIALTLLTILQIIDGRRRFYKRKNKGITFLTQENCKKSIKEEDFTKDNALIFEKKDDDERNICVLGEDFSKFACWEKVSKNGCENDIYIEVGFKLYLNEYIWKNIKMGDSHCNEICLKLTNSKMVANSSETLQCVGKEDTITNYCRDELEGCWRRITSKCSNDRNNIQNIVLKHGMTEINPFEKHEPTTIDKSKESQINFLPESDCNKKCDDNVLKPKKAVSVLFFLMHEDDNLLKCYYDSKGRGVVDKYCTYGSMSCWEKISATCKEDVKNISNISELREKIKKKILEDYKNDSISTKKYCKSQFPKESFKFFEANTDDVGKEWSLNCVMLNPDGESISHRQDYYCTYGKSTGSWTRKMDSCSADIKLVGEKEFEKVMIEKVIEEIKKSKINEKCKNVCTKYLYPLSEGTTGHVSFESNEKKLLVCKKGDLYYYKDNYCSDGSGCWLRKSKSCKEDFQKIEEF
jgi:hypothetical protein